jgi:hypothetical protein
VYIFGAVFFTLFFAQFSYTNSFTAGEKNKAVSQVLLHPKTPNLSGVSIK